MYKKIISYFLILTLFLNFNIVNLNNVYAKTVDSNQRIDIGKYYKIFSIDKTDQNRMIVAGSFHDDLYIEKIDEFFKTENCKSVPLEGNFLDVKTFNDKNGEVNYAVGYVKSDKLKNDIINKDSKLKSGAIFIKFDSVLNVQSYYLYDEDKNEIFYSLDQMQDDGIITAGVIDESFNTGGWGYNKIYNNRSNSKGLIVKFNSKGNLVWEKVVGGKDENYCFYKVKATKDNGFIVVGSAWIKNNTEMEDGIIIKYKKTLLGYEEEWRKLINDKGQNDYLLDVDIDDNDNIYVVGRVGYDFFGDKKGIIAKFSKKGESLWCKVFDYVKEISSIKIYKNNIYLAADGINDKQISLSGYLLKLDSNGNVLIINKPENKNDNAFTSLVISQDNIVMIGNDYWDGGFLYCYNINNVVNNITIKTDYDKFQKYIKEDNYLLNVDNKTYIVATRTESQTEIPLFFNSNDKSLVKDINTYKYLYQLYYLGKNKDKLKENLSQLIVLTKALVFGKTMVSETGNFLIKFWSDNLSAVKNMSNDRKSNFIKVAFAVNELFYYSPINDKVPIYMDLLKCISSLDNIQRSISQDGKTIIKYKNKIKEIENDYKLINQSVVRLTRFFNVLTEFGLTVGNGTISYSNKAPFFKIEGKGIKEQALNLTKETLSIVTETSNVFINSFTEITNISKVQNNSNTLKNLEQLMKNINNIADKSKKGLIPLLEKQYGELLNNALDEVKDYTVKKLNLDILNAIKSGDLNSLIAFSALFYNEHESKITSLKIYSKFKVDADNSFVTKMDAAYARFKNLVSKLENQK